MNILLVRRFPIIDGTFTLVVRLARELKKRGHTCYFLKFDIDYAESLLAQINEHCIIIPVSELNSEEKKHELPSIDVIFGIIGGDLLIWTYKVLKNKFFPQASVVFGVYHPRAFIPKSIIGPSPDSFFYKWFFKRMPASNLIFMNEAVLNTHQRYFNLSFEGTNLIPLPVEVRNQKRELDNINKNAIVSIGRLVEFKNYVIPVINLIAELNKKGFKFELHVYGDGSLRDKTEKEIEKCNVKEFVFLYGTLDYDKIPSVLKDKLLFIGMGTALVEAAANHVPAIVAIESNSKPTTYGWFSEIGGGHVGEVMEGKETKPMSDYILRAYHASPEEYKLIADKCSEKAGEFSLDKIVDKYEEVFMKSDKSFTISISKFKHTLLRLFRQPYKLLVPVKYKRT